MTTSLRTLIRTQPWTMRVLATVRDAGIPQAWVGAGLLRDLVWGRLYGPGFDHRDVRDVDVAFYDPHDLSPAGDERAGDRLRRAWPDVPWEATNQAAVHTWYTDAFGGDPPPPLTSIRDAVATWPETATAVAVRLLADGRIEVCAPLGTGDLMDGVWRANPARTSRRRSAERLARHRPWRRWPGVTVIPPR